MTTGCATALEKAIRDLVLVEAAIEGADMGDRGLQEVIACKLLDVLTSLRVITEDEMFSESE